MEYLDGVTLSDLRSKRPDMPVALRFHVLCEVARGLVHAHSATGPDGKPLGLVHRDVSPQNIVLTRQGEVKLIDFGIAKANERSTLTEAGTVKGKLPYMSPEQASGQDVDWRSDLFALGVVAHELLTDTDLYGLGATEEVRQRVAAGGAPISDGLDDAAGPAAEVIRQCLDKDPQRRPSATLDVLRAFEAALRAAADASDGRDLVAAAVSDYAGERPRKRPRRRVARRTRAAPVVPGPSTTETASSARFVAMVAGGIILLAVFLEIFR
jgi:serine/threonine-protein kinase